MIARLLHRKSALLLPLMIGMLVFAGSADAQNSIHGKWEHQSDFQKILVIFNPDGRYFLSYDYGNNSPTFEYGFYTLTGDQVHFRTRTAENTSTFTLITDGMMTLNEGSFYGQTFQFDPTYDMAADWKSYDDQEAVADEKWRTFLTIKPMGAQPPHVPVGDIPPDPNVSRIFPNPTVFSPQRLYTYLNAPKTVTFSNGETRSVSNKEDIHFLSTGRSYARFLNYYPGGSVHGKVTEFWGRYTITPAVRNDLYWGIVDAVRIENDSGEVVEMELHDGRRTLHWMSLKGLYGEVNWELAAAEGRTDPPANQPPPTLSKGDVNGDGGVDVSDAIMTLRATVGLLALEPDQFSRADLNGDSVADVIDATRILRISVGLESPPGG